MPRLFRLLLCPLVLFSLAAGPAGGQEDRPLEGIAAVVNDEVISLSDVEARLRLALLTSGLPPSPENQQRLMPQVVRALIDEALQRQEAARLGVEIDQAAVDEAIGRIAQQNETTADQLRAGIAAQGVSPSTLEDQIRTQLAWRQVVQRQLGATVQIGDAEVDEALARIEANTGQPEYLVADIFLAVDDPADEAEVRAFAEQLIAEMRQGARFSAVARQFSQGAGAGDGGDMGWVMRGQLEPALDAALADAEPGALAGPIRTTAGYHILLVRDRRLANTPDALDAEVTLQQIGLGFPPDMTQDILGRIMAVAQDVSNTVRGCDAMAARARELGVEQTLNAGTGPLRALAPEVRDVVRDLPIGVPTPPQRLADGVVVYMVCARGEPPAATPPNREAIAETLFQEQADRVARRYLRDLRNAAFVDLRV
jgi:peptidyl-prolyl cis-trans isomerase SurA